MYVQEVGKIQHSHSRSGRVQNHMNDCGELKTMSGYLPVPSARLCHSELIENKVMAANIDVSGLTPHEIAKIQQVMLRADRATRGITQQAGKMRENLESLQVQVQNAKRAATSKLSKQKRNLCQICFHVDLNITSCHWCTICHRKFCSRCGHRTATTLHHAAPSQWLCNLCYHERQYLSVSGTWIDKTQSNDKQPDKQHGRRRRHTMADVLESNGKSLPVPIIPVPKPASCAVIEVQFGYVAAQASLVFTIIRATCLQYRDGRDKKAQINPYCKVYLLPDRSESNKRRTATLSDTGNPEWNRSFMYQNVSESALQHHSLEISVWSHRGHVRSRKFLGQVTIFLGSVAFNNQASCFPLEYPETAYYLPPPTPEPIRCQDSNLDSAVTKRFSYSRSQFSHDESRNSWASVDSANSSEEHFVPIRASRSYDTGLDELSSHSSRKVLSGEEDRHSMASDGQSVQSKLDVHHGSDMLLGTKPPQSPSQLKAFTFKKFLLKKDASEEDPDALVAEFYKLKRKEANKQTRELEVGDIIRATHSRTASPAPQGCQSSGAPNPIGSYHLNDSHVINPVPAVSIAECDDADRSRKESSTSSSLLSAPLGQQSRRHSAPYDLHLFSSSSGVFLPQERSASQYDVTADHLYPNTLPIRKSGSVSLCSEDAVSIISSSSTLPVGGRRSMLGLGVGQLLRSSHIGMNATGKIQLGFSVQQELLEVYVLSAEDLSYHPADIAAGHITPPYVKLYLLHGTRPMAGEKEKRTKEALMSTNPEFNETITFKCSNLLHKTLKIKVKYEPPKRGFRHQSKEIGQALVSLDSLHLSGDPVMEWYKLFPASS